MPRISARARFALIVHTLSALAHLVPAVAWSAVIPAPWAALLAAGMALVTAWRIQLLLRDPARPWWVSRLIDEPVFWHWGAAMLAIPLFALAALTVAVASVTGCSPSDAGASFAFGPSGLALASYAAGLAFSGWGVWGRRRLVRARTLQVTLAGLDPAFDGYRIAHLTDLHLGSFDRLARGLEWARAANAVGADLIVVTGDLVTSGTRYYEDAAETVGALRAPDGVLVSLGNHDQWDPASLTRALELRGARVLHNAWARIERGPASLHVAGLGDYYTDRNDLDATLDGIPEGACTVLLSHYPRFFEEAARRGVALVLAGHTHGGQIGVPFLAERLNIGRAAKQASRGLVTRGKSALYVNAGLGTTGPPIRLGVAPEIAVVVLRAGAPIELSNPRPARTPAALSR